MFVFGGVSYQIRILMHQCKVRHTQRIEPLRIFEHFAYCVFSTRIAYCVLANTAKRKTQYCTQCGSKRGGIDYCITQHAKRNTQNANPVKQPSTATKCVCVPFLH